MLVDDDAACDGKALSRPLTNLLGGKEWIEDLVPDLLGYPGTGVADRDLHRLAHLTRTYDQLAPISGVFDYRCNCVRRVHHQVEDLTRARGTRLHLVRREIVVLGLDHRQRLFGAVKLIEHGPHSGRERDRVDEAHAREHRRLAA